ncbi:MAG: type II secretion system protein [Planctomycetota bacterium]
MVARRRSGRGFLLVDVIVGTVLLGITLAAILSVSVRAISVQRQAGELRQAAMVADEIMSIVHAYGTEDYRTVIAARGTASPPFARYGYRVDVDEGSAGDADEVLVRVSWQSSGGRPRSFELRALIAPRLGDDPDPNRQPPEPIDR